MKISIAAIVTVTVLLVAFPAKGRSAEMSAAQLAARMRSGMEGTARIRSRLETNARGAETPVFQLLIKERRTARSTDVVYEVLWPKERKGEAIILHQRAGSAPGGAIFIPPDTVKKLGTSEMDEGLLGSDLTYQDAVENFFAWPDQTIVGSETVDGIECVVLDSKPGRSGATIYGRARTWIDPQRLVPMRIEKFSKSGNLARRIEITRVVRDHGRPIPASLTVSGGSGSVTKLSGSRIDRDVSVSDSDFSAEAMVK